jgi:hypothetical protein
MNPRNEVERLRAELDKLEAERDALRPQAAIGAAFEEEVRIAIAYEWDPPRTERQFVANVQERAAGAPVSGDPT